MFDLIRCEMRCELPADGEELRIYLKFIFWNNKLCSTYMARAIEAGVVKSRISQVVQQTLDAIYLKTRNANCVGHHILLSNDGRTKVFCFSMFLWFLLTVCFC